MFAEKSRKAEEARIEKDRKKDDPVCKAQKAALGLQKDIAAVQVWKMDIESSKASTEQRSKYVKKVNDMLKEFANVRRALETATDDNADAHRQRAELLKQKNRDLKSEVKLMLKLAAK